MDVQRFKNQGICERRKENVGLSEGSRLALNVPTLRGEFSVGRFLDAGFSMNLHHSGRTLFDLIVPEDIYNCCVSKDGKSSCMCLEGSSETITTTWAVMRDLATLPVHEDTVQVIIATHRILLLSQSRRTCRGDR